MLLQLERADHAGLQLIILWTLQVELVILHERRHHVFFGTGDLTLQKAQFADVLRRLRGETDASNLAKSQLGDVQRRNRLRRTLAQILHAAVDRVAGRRHLGLYEHVVDCHFAGQFVQPVHQRHFPVQRLDEHEKSKLHAESRECTTSASDESTPA